MAVTVIQTGAALQLLNEDGTRTALTLPTGVSLSQTVPPRFVVYGSSVVLVNTPSQPLAIDANGTVRILSPRPPRLAPILAGVSGGTLTGSYRVKETFVTLDSFGNILSESDYSIPSTRVAITAKFLGVSNADVSPDAITLRRFYRTTDNGAIYFQWVDLDGNTITTIQDDLADAGLSIFAAPVLGTPPRLVTIAEFRGRLFGSGDTDIDDLRYTEAGVPYAWPVDNVFSIPGQGSDQWGITALLPRREALGVGRRNIISQIVGTGVENGTDTDFSVVVVSRELGVKSQESMRVFRDVAYFLWEDGVYSWGPNGVTCVSNGFSTGKGNVRSWFATDSYFNRDLFPQAFAHIDPQQAVYRLFLASAGSSVIDSWVEYNIDQGVWFGPHKTGLFTPVSAFHRTTITGQQVPVIAGPQSVFETQEIRTDGFGTAIIYDAVGKKHALDVPDIDKYFGEISLFGKAQTSGVLTVQTRTGEQNATRTQTQYYDMTKPRQRLGRPGRGKHMQVELVNGNVGEDVEVFGYEVNPVSVIGRR